MYLRQTERFWRKNVIFVEIIPNMRKKQTPNTCNRPLVDDICVAWEEGFYF